MPRILCYDGKPVALVEFLPNNAFGDSVQDIETDICERLNLDEDATEFVTVTKAELTALRKGEEVQKVVATRICDEDDEEEAEEDNEDDDAPPWAIVKAKRTTDLLGEMFKNE